MKKLFKNNFRYKNFNLKYYNLDINNNILKNTNELNIFNNKYLNNEIDGNEKYDNLDNKSNKFIITNICYKFNNLLTFILNLCKIKIKFLIKNTYMINDIFIIKKILINQIKFILSSLTSNIDNENNYINYSKINFKNKLLLRLENIYNDDKLSKEEMLEDIEYDDRYFLLSNIEFKIKSYVFNNFFKKNNSYNIFRSKFLIFKDIYKKLLKLLKTYIYINYFIFNESKKINLKIKFIKNLIKYNKIIFKKINKYIFEYYDILIDTIKNLNNLLITSLKFYFKKFINNLGYIHKNLLLFKYYKNNKKYKKTNSTDYSYSYFLYNNLKNNNDDNKINKVTFYFTCFKKIIRLYLLSFNSIYLNNKTFYRSLRDSKLLLKKSILVKKNVDRLKKTNRRIKLIIQNVYNHLNRLIENYYYYYLTDIINKEIPDNTIKEIDVEEDKIEYEANNDIINSDIDKNENDEKFKKNLDLKIKFDKLNKPISLFNREALEIKFVFILNSNFNYISMDKKKILKLARYLKKTFKQKFRETYLFPVKLNSSYILKIKKKFNGCRLKRQKR